MYKCPDDFHIGRADRERDSTMNQRETVKWIRDRLRERQYNELETDWERQYNESETDWERDSTMNQRQTERDSTMNQRQTERVTVQWIRERDSTMNQRQYNESDIDWDRESQEEIDDDIYKEVYTLYIEIYICIRKGRHMDK